MKIAKHLCPLKFQKFINKCEARQKAEFVHNNPIELNMSQKVKIITSAKVTSRAMEFQGNREK